MDRENILEYLRVKYEHLPCYPQILKHVETTLKEHLNFQLDENELGVTIKSIIDNVERGSFALIKINKDPTNDDISVISVKKEYNPQNEVRYGWMTEVGLNMFTDASSAIFDKNGLCLYRSWYSDENKYHDVPEDKTPDSIMTAISKTTPKYNSKGAFVEDPESSYRPFTNIWERVDKTRVIHRHGRSPINGQYSDVGIVYTADGKEKEEYFLQENHGRVYSKSKGWLGTLKSVAKRIEPLIDSHRTQSMWDDETVIDTWAIVDILPTDNDFDEI